MSACPVTGDVRCLILRGLYADGGVEGQRSVENAARDLPAIGHLAESRGFHRGRDLRVNRFDCREQRDLGLRNAERVRQIDRILHDVNLVLELRFDVDGRVGNQQGARVGRRVHDEHVA